MPRRSKRAHTPLDMPKRSKRDYTHRVGPFKEYRYIVIFVVTPFDDDTPTSKR